MSKKGRDWYLKEVIGHLKSAFVNKLSTYTIEGPDKVLEWTGQPRQYWPKADIWLESPKKIVIVEIDNDSDPRRSLVKYWPFFEEYFSTNNQAIIQFIEVCKFGSTVGRGYGVLFDFMRKQLMNTYSGKLDIIFKERNNDSSHQMAQWIILKI